MKAPAFLLLLALCGPLAARTDTPVTSFASQGRQWTVTERTLARGDVELVLAGGGRETVLSAEMGGENYWEKTVADPGNFTVFWLHYDRGVRELVLYDHRQGFARRLSLAGFRSFPQVECVSADGHVRDLYFLGEQGKSVNLFHYDLANRVLTCLTDYANCVRGFTLVDQSEIVSLSCETLAETSQLVYQPKTRQILSSERSAKIRPVRSAPTQTTARSPETYNTYVGFGDSITWGQIALVQHPVECFLNQIRLALSPTWGEMIPINKGAPATTTYCGVWRIDQGGELDGIEAQYFLLMYGFNDLRRPTWDGVEPWVPEPDPCPSATNPSPGPVLFSAAYSRENIEFMIDAARQKGMDVIVSTLTPRKDEPFVSQYFWWENNHALSDAILEVAAAKGVASIDTLSAFMNHNPPDGWKDLLEEPGTVIIDGKPETVKGNHPNAEGQRLIAGLYEAALNRVHAPTVIVSEAPTTVYSGDSVRFSARALPWEDATLEHVAWTFSGDAMDETGATVTHRVSGGNRTMTATATATDSKGRQGTASVAVTVRALYPALPKWRKVHVRTVIYDRDAWLVSWVPDLRNQAMGFQVTAYWVYRLDALGAATRIAIVDPAAPFRCYDLQAPARAAPHYAVATVDATGHVSPLTPQP